MNLNELNIIKKLLKKKDAKNGTKYTKNFNLSSKFEIINLKTKLSYLYSMIYNTELVK